MKKYRKQFNKLSDEDKLKEFFICLSDIKRTITFFPLLKDLLSDENIVNVCSIEDTLVVINIFAFNFANFENRNWKENLPSLLWEKFSIQSLTSNK